MHLGDQVVVLVLVVVVVVVAVAVAVVVVVVAVAVAVVAVVAVVVVVVVAVVVGRVSVISVIKGGFIMTFCTLGSIEILDSLQVLDSFWWGWYGV